MPGKLFGVGVGPGDPELLTLKAVRTISEAEVIALPKTDSQNITALQIVEPVIDLSDKEIIEIYLPMTRDKDVLNNSHQNAVQQLMEILQQDKNIAFLTLGDPSIYSTYIYLHERVLLEGFAAELIAGVPSFCAVAAKLNQALCKGSEPLHLIPASYKGSGDYLNWPGTKILMKSGKALAKVIDALEEKALLGCSSMVERCGMEGEQIYRDLAQIDTGKSYFSTIVVKESVVKEDRER
jgi:precorrin-2/cobalt-factor-2 C20-methyltransferase